MKKWGKIFMLALPFAVLCGTATAQNVAIKTNLATWGMGGTPNLGVEIALGKKVTLDIEGMYNPWYFGNKTLNKKMQYWAIMPEAKFWQWEKFNRGYVGVHVMTGSFNFSGVKLPFGLFPAVQKYRYEGVGVGVGVSYGWQWYLSPHWNFEASLGVGYMYVQFNQLRAPNSGNKIAKNVGYHYFGPTKIGLSFSYLFGSKK